MTSRNFQGIQNLLEVVCGGKGFNSNVKLLSLQIVELPETRIISSLNVFSGSCIAFNVYSSCIIANTDTHLSKLSILVSDGIPGEKKAYGCLANAVTSLGTTVSKSWNITIEIIRK